MLRTCPAPGQPYSKNLHLTDQCNPPACRGSPCCECKGEGLMVSAVSACSTLSRQPMASARTHSRAVLTASPLALPMTLVILNRAGRPLKLPSHACTSRLVRLLCICSTQASIIPGQLLVAAQLGRDTPYSSWHSGRAVGALTRPSDRKCAIDRAREGCSKQSGALVSRSVNYGTGCSLGMSACGPLPSPPPSALYSLVP